MGFFSGFGFSDLIGGIGSLLGIGGQAMSNRAQAKENEKNRQFALDMWNAENAYNDPSAMMQRFTNAGLNPALIYGDGASTLSAHAQTPNTDNKYGNVFQRGLSDYFTAKQIDLQRQSTESTVLLNEANAQKAKDEAELAKQEAKRKEIENTYADANELVDLLIKGNTSEAGRLANQLARQSNPVQISILQQTLENAKKEGKIKEEEANKLQALIRQIDKDTEKIAEEIKTEQTKQEVNKASAEAQRASAAASKSMAGYYDALKANQPFERKRISSEIAKNSATLDLIKAETGKNDKEAEKLANDIAIALEKGDADWLKTNITNRYSGLGALLNPAVDMIDAVKNGHVRQSDYYRGSSGKINYKRKK